jgi:ribokinase
VAASLLAGVSRQGFTSMVGCVGADNYGRATRDNFEAYGVDITHLGTAPKPVSSGLACIQVDERGENSIVIIPGANYSLLPKTAAQLPKPFFAKATHALFQLEIEPGATLKAMEAAKGEGVTTVLNPAPARPLTELPDGFLE